MTTRISARVVSSSCRGPTSSWGGKDGRLFLLRRNQLGDAADNTKAVDIFQATPAQGTGLPRAPYSNEYHHIHGSPVYWDGPMGRWIYIGGEADYLRAFAFDGNAFAHEPASLSFLNTPIASMPGAIMSLSADGRTPGSGILWASFPFHENSNQGVVEGVMYALDASDLTRVLWHTKQRPGRDAVGNFPKFNPPVVADGRVYLGTFCGPDRKVMLPETAVEGPALADLNDNLLVLAWTGSDPDHSINVAVSAEGNCFCDTVTLSEHSPHGPALASGNGRVFLAWTGTDGNTSLNIISSTDARTFAGKLTIGGHEPGEPALAFGNGRLYLAWTGSDGARSLNVMSSTDGQTFVNKVTLGEHCCDGPALAVIDGVLHLSWSGTDADHSLNVMELADGVTWTNKRTLRESSDFHPAFVARHPPFLVWTGRDAQRHLNLLAARAGSTDLVDKLTFDDLSSGGVGCAVFRDEPFVAWSGTDNPSHVNVARMTPGYLSVYGLLASR